MFFGYIVGPDYYGLQQSSNGNGVIEVGLRERLCLQLYHTHYIFVPYRSLVFVGEY